MSTGPEYPRPNTGLPLPGSQRVSDDERERVSQLLSEHYAHGRLELEEFEARSALALRASTRRELTRLTSDLPALAGQPKGAGWPRILIEVLGGIAVGLTGAVLLILSLILLVAGAAHWWQLVLVGLLLGGLGVGGVALGVRDAKSRRRL